MLRRVTDLLLAGGTVVDGTGAPPRRAEVAIDRGRVAAVGAGLGPAAEVLDVSGLVVAPGVVDIHSHADFTLLVDGRAQSSVLQGITTIAVGNCGHGLAPVEPHAVEAARMNTFCCRSAWEHVHAPGTFEDYVEALRAARPAVNVVPLVPHGALRLNVAGYALRELTGGELDRLRGMVREAMEAGAAGLSTGLEYAPGIAATEAELRALCEPVGTYGGLYATHCRNREAGIVDAAREAAAIAAATGSRLQLSHFVRRPSSPADGGALEREAREVALASGASAGFDVFPFAFGPTPLASLLEQEQRAGTRAEMAERLAAGPAGADTRVAKVLEGGIGAEMYVASDGGRGTSAGRSLAEIAAARGISVPEAAHALLAEAGEDFYDVVVVERWAADADLDRAVLDDSFCLMGDGVTGALDGPLEGLAFSLSDWGWVVRALAHYVRDTQALALEQAVHRMTLAPARRLGLADRGALLPGMAADVAVFDLARVGGDVAPDHLIAPPRGVPHVLVNGRPVVRDGRQTADRPGDVGRVSSRS
jgi:N-acyl-D-amino-acid deacylase